MSSPFVTWVEPVDLGFNSAHFITYGNVCENLHGHNFHARVAAHGDDMGEGYVLDFVALTRLARGICEELSDRVILPGNSPVVRLEEEDGLVKVSSFGKRYWLERDGCAILPIGNATAELVARYIGSRLVDALGREGLAGNLRLLEVGVEEADRQWGISRHALS
ncbi:MAG: 6-carboxytetrahydropterin synthase [Gallionellaceae bacterium]|nr:6-carboxytetrahydropterin synthase [Gallionellaceae bacterium]